MKVKFYLTVAVLILLAAFMCIWDTTSQAPASAQSAGALQPARQGAWLDSMIFSEQSAPSDAIAQLQANQLDVYAYAVSNPSLFQTVLEDPSLTQSNSYGSYTELTFNPYGPTFYDGRLNPFCNAKIREAMNWLIDRDKIAQEIYGGLAIPKYLTLTHIDADYQRFETTAETLEAYYAYNFSQAQATIVSEMVGMGASLVNGKWYFNGQPVTVIFIIRVEDQRRPIGDYVSNQLEKIGFTVDRQYKTRSQASPIWNQSDPGEGQWHIYTGGWIYTNISRDNSTDFGYFYTPLGSGSPLWQAYNPTPEFQAICDKLWAGDFATLAERAALFEQALDMEMSDSGGGAVGSGSLRVWLVNSVGFNPRRAGTSVASDLAGGLPGAAMFPYVARFDGVEGGSLRVAQPGLFFGAWNPVAGSNWTYDTFPMRATADLGIIADPSTGLYWPLRIECADVTVRAGLPVSKTLDWVTLNTAPLIEVPGEAWVDWDATNQEFITAGEKYPYPIMANSKVTVYYPADFYTTVTWHDGSPVSIGDIVMGMIMQFDYAKPESPIYDETRAWALDSFLSHFKGVVIESIDPLIITTYDDLTYLDAEWMVNAWYLAGGYYSNGNASWHALTPAIRAEAASQLAFSESKAGQLGVPWTDFLAGSSLDILEYWMDQSASENYIPYAPTLSQYVTPEEATSRWTALQAWYTTRHHFWTGTGPFYVEQVAYDTKSLTLAHFNGYPDASGRWDSFSTPAQPILEINHASGSPGSFFNLTGTGFPANGQAWIMVNDRIIGFVQADSSGNVLFTLSTDEIRQGEYHLRVSINPSAGVLVTLDDDQPLWPREGELPVIAIPPTQYIHIPLVSKN